MTKQELTNSLAVEFHITKKKASEICELVFKFVGKSLMEDREFRWPGFGSFKINKQKKDEPNE